MKLFIDCSKTAPTFLPPKVNDSRRPSYLSGFNTNNNISRKTRMLQQRRINREGQARRRKLELENSTSNNNANNDDDESGSSDSYLDESSLSLPIACEETQFDSPPPSCTVSLSSIEAALQDFPPPLPVTSHPVRTPLIAAYNRKKFK